MDGVIINEIFEHFREQKRQIKKAEEIEKAKHILKQNDYLVEKKSK